MVPGHLIDLFTKTSVIHNYETRHAESNLLSLDVSILYRNNNNQNQIKKYATPQVNKVPSYRPNGRKYRKNKDLQEELVSLQKTLELVEPPVQEPVRQDKCVRICGHCHHRGHRKDARHTCIHVKCNGFRYCGHQKRHPEHA